MAYNRTDSIFVGFLFGIAPGGLLGIIGLALGGEWAWTLGLIAVWLILIGVFAGPMLGSIGPEIIAEKAALTGAVLGAVPGILLFAFRTETSAQINLLAIAGGSILGAFIGHRISVHRDRQGAIPSIRRSRGHPA